MIEQFHCCSLLWQLALNVLNLLKQTLDTDDIAQLKNFVRTNLLEKSEFQFESGNITASLNLAPLIKIALEIKPTSSLLNADPEWQEFYNTTLRSHQVRWSKRLEDSANERNKNKESQSSEDLVYLQNEEYDDNMGELLSNPQINRRSRPYNNKQRYMSADFGRLSSLENLEDVTPKKSKDDWELTK